MLGEDTGFFDKPITRRDSLKSLGRAALISSLLPFIPKNATAQTKRPNIIFVLTDDQRWDALGCMGHPFLKTPNMDRLASEGVLFENAFVTTSLCSPSRASFLTGRYAHSHGVRSNATVWNNQNVTFLELIKASGYDTAFIGKWHMPGKGLPQLRGLDRFISFTALAGQGMYNNCPLIIDGVETAREGKYITEDLTDFAIQFIEKERTNPFCLYLSHKAAHFGYLPPDHLNRLYNNVDLHLPPESNRWTPFTGKNLIYGQLFPLDYMYRNYCETLVSVDEQLGRVIDKLEDLGELDNTVIIYAGDNGFFWGEHGLIDKRLAYEESIRIPFIVRGPQIIRNPGRRAGQMILNIDLAPTLLDMIGLSIPEEIQGQSFLPILKGESVPGRHSWLYEYFPDYPIHVPPITAVRTDRYKYIEYHGVKRNKELFDLHSDPKERTNLMTTSEGQSLAVTLKQELEQLKQDTGYY